MAKILKKRQKHLNKNIRICNCYNCESTIEFNLRTDLKQLGDSRSPWYECPVCNAHLSVNIVKYGQTLDMYHVIPSVKDS